MRLSGAIALTLLCGLAEGLYLARSSAAQEPLRQVDRTTERLAGPTKSENHIRPFDAAENSVGLLLSTHAGMIVHLWMPIGKRIFVRDSPSMPSHPDTARITTLINSSPKLASPEQLEQIECDVWTTSNRSEGRRERLKVSFSKKDELVKFGDPEGPGKRWWLSDREVESFRCV